MVSGEKLFFLQAQFNKHLSGRDRPAVSYSGTSDQCMNNMFIIGQAENILLKENPDISLLSDIKTDNEFVAASERIFVINLHTRDDEVETGIVEFGKTYIF